ncbi:hypothetical protein CRG98_017580 [Punica granatum]|uniref:Uncharacterized protein n=1 Tax=Punica granatum TaxID=22663 RepID=A0A2I0K0D2_PUNGR|nr:hypothetical protein CRG98_017580 [Punica granatum]
MPVHGQQMPWRPRIEAFENGIPLVSPKITGITNAKTTTNSGRQSLEARRRSTQELKSLVMRTGHPQRTSNRPSDKTSLRQINPPRLHMMQSSSRHSIHATNYEPCLSLHHPSIILTQRQAKLLFSAPYNIYSSYVFLSACICCFRGFTPTIHCTRVSHPHRIALGFHICITLHSGFTPVSNCVQVSHPVYYFRVSHPFYCTRVSHPPFVIQGFTPTIHNSGFHTRFYCIHGFTPTFTTFRVPHPHRCFQGFTFASLHSRFQTRFHYIQSFTPVVLHQGFHTRGSAFRVSHPHRCIKGFTPISTSFWLTNSSNAYQQ